MNSDESKDKVNDKAKTEQRPVAPDEGMDYVRRVRDQDTCDAMRKYGYGDPTLTRHR